MIALVAWCFVALAATAAVVGVVRWSRFVASRYGAPRWTRYVGPSGVIASAGIGVGGTAVGLHRALHIFDDAPAVDPSDKARILAEAISEAMHMAFIGTGIALATVIFLLILTFRYHWSARSPKPLGSPPYR